MKFGNRKRELKDEYLAILGSDFDFYLLEQSEK